MENLEVVLVDFQKEKLDKLVFEELKISISDVKSSHFFDKNSEEDVEFHQVKSVKNVLSPSGTGNIFLHQLDLGYKVKEILILFSFDDEFGDIVFNFPESELFTGEGTEIMSNSKKILTYFAYLKDKMSIPKVIIGFEPATDNDTCLIELNEETIDLDALAAKMLTKSQLP